MIRFASLTPLLKEKKREEKEREEPSFYQNMGNFLLALNSMC
jgi:hypothetical protein